MIRRRRQWRRYLYAFYHQRDASLRTRRLNASNRPRRDAVVVMHEHNRDAEVENNPVPVETPDRMNLPGLINEASGEEPDEEEILNADLPVDDSDEEEQNEESGGVESFLKGLTPPPTPINYNIARPSMSRIVFDYAAESQVFQFGAKTLEGESMTHINPYIIGLTEIVFSEENMELRKELAKVKEELARANEELATARERCKLFNNWNLYEPEPLPNPLSFLISSKPRLSDGAAQCHDDASEERSRWGAR